MFTLCLQLSIVCALDLYSVNWRSFMTNTVTVPLSESSPGRVSTTTKFIYVTDIVNPHNCAFT